MTRWQRRVHLWVWLCAALAILACAVLALDERRRVSSAFTPIDLGEAR